MHTLNEMVLTQPLNTPKPKKGAINPLTLKGGGLTTPYSKKGLSKITIFSTIGSGYCLPANLGMDDRYIPSGRDSVVKFDAVSGETSERWEFESAFFKEHVKPAAYYCYVSNLTTYLGIKLGCAYSQKSFLRRMFRFP